MKSAKTAVSPESNEKIPPRERLLAVAAELFYRHGIRAVGVEAIAEAAGTNKMPSSTARESWPVQAIPQPALPDTVHTSFPP